MPSRCAMSTMRTAFAMFLTSFLLDYEVNKIPINFIISITVFGIFVNKNL